MFKKILVPLDGSELAERALEPALALACQQQDSEVILLSVPVYRDILVPSAAGFDLLLPDRSLEQFQQDVESYLDEVKTSWTRPGIQLRAVVEDGDVASVIVDTAEEQAVDLIVMTTHGRSGLKRWVYGSVTEKVLRSTDAAMLIIRSK